jgi:hypothetical protein
MVKWICRLFLGYLDIGIGRIVAQKSKNLTCFCPKSGPQFQYSMNTIDQMTISGLLFIIVLIHWKLVKWICRLFLGHLAIGNREDCGSEVWKTHLFLPRFLPQVCATNPTLHSHCGPDDHLRTTVHHCFDPLEAGEMDLQVMLGSFGHWQWGLWLCAFPLALNSGRRLAGKGKIILTYGQPRNILCVYVMPILIFDALNDVSGVVPVILIEQRPSKPLRQHGQ